MHWLGYSAQSPRRRSRRAHASQRNSRVIKVQVRSNESLESALRRFKRQCNYSGIFRLAKANAYHEKRSDARRRERRERLRTIQKATRKNDPSRVRRRARPRPQRS
jgi:small subunit ribosomal protein S21